MATTAITRIDRNAALSGPDTCEAMIQDETAFDVVKSAFSAKLPEQQKHDKAVQLIREAVVHVANSRASDKICRCSVASVIDSLTACARMDWSLTQALGHAYLVPFKGVCILMPGYRGYVKAIIETGRVTHLETAVVYTTDEFEFWRDENGPHIKHIPDIEAIGDESKLRAVYLVAQTPGSERPMLEIMNRAEIDKVQKCSTAPANESPWKWWKIEMSRKSVINRFRKSIPLGLETDADRRLADAMDLENTMYDPKRLAEYKEMADEHSRSLKERAMAPVVGENAPQSDEQPQPDPTPAPTLKAAKAAWWKLAQAAAKESPDEWKDLKANAGKWFEAFASSVLGHSIGDCERMGPEDLAAVIADMDENHDARPRDER